MTVNVEDGNLPDLTHTHTHLQRQTSEILADNDCPSMATGRLARQNQNQKHTEVPPSKRNTSNERTGQRKEGTTSK